MTDSRSLHCEWHGFWSLTRRLNSFFWRQVVANSPDQPKPLHDYEQGWSAINELIRADGTWSGFERNVVLREQSRWNVFRRFPAPVGLTLSRTEGRLLWPISIRMAAGNLPEKNRNAPQLRLLKNVMEDLPPSIAFRLRGVKK